MINITGKRNQLKELIGQSKYLALMPKKREQMLAHLEALPQEVESTDAEVLDAYIQLLGEEKDPDIAEGIKSISLIKEFLAGMVAIEEKTLEGILAVKREELRRMDEMKARLDKDPEADVSDLLSPIVI